MRVRSGPSGNWLFSSPLPVEAHVLLESHSTVTEVPAPVSDNTGTGTLAPFASVGLVRVVRLFQFACAAAGTPAISVASNADPVASVGSSAPKFRPIFTTAI